MANPWYDGLLAIKATLDAAPAIANLPTPQLRELPYLLAGDAPPLCLVCPARRGKKVARGTFGADRVASVWWDLPCVVLLVAAGDRKVAAHLEARLRLDWDVTERLNVPTLAGEAKVIDVDVDCQAVADVQAHLGTNFVVGGLGLTLRVPVKRGAIANG